MTIQFSPEETPAVDMLAEVETLYRMTAEQLIMAVNAIGQGRYHEAKTASQSVRDLKAAYFLVMEEREKVEKFRKHITGAVGTGTLELHAARDEIGRRLARLRDAAAS